MRFRKLSIAAAIFLQIAGLLNFIAVTRSIFPPPQHGNLRFCSTVACWVENIAMYRSYDPIIIALLTHSFAEDSYLSLYLGSIQQQFSLPDVLSLTIVLQRPPGMQMYDVGAMMLQTLPRKSVFVLIQHGMERFGVADFNRALDKNITAPIIYHMNHEQPWQGRDSIAVTNSFDSDQAWIDFYSRFPLVLRNYYYKPFHSIAHYLPLHPPFEGFVLSNHSSSITERIAVPASRRSQRCYFRGRFTYNYYRNINNSSSNADLEQVTLTSQEIDRGKIYELSESGKIGGCLIESHEPSDADLAEYDRIYIRYMEKMVDAAFVLCPAGNNPETFRHYEALETGAIPVVIHPTEPAINFFDYDLWASYPGPVLQHWSQLENFLNSISKQEMDSLQALVWRWYQNFKFERMSRLKQKLLHSFSDTTQARSSTAATTSATNAAEQYSSSSNSDESTTATKTAAAASKQQQLQLQFLQQEVAAIRQQQQQQIVQLQSIEMELRSSRIRENQLLNDLRIIINALFATSDSEESTTGATDESMAATVVANADTTTTNKT